MPSAPIAASDDRRSVLSQAAPLLLMAAFVALAAWERHAPLRPPTRPRIERAGRNLLIGAGGAMVVAAIESPITGRLAELAQRRRLGLVRHLGLPGPVQRLLALLLLDYSLYGWHRLMHRSPFLWRWHRIHHADPDLDVSTGLRFHAMEMLWSVPWRAAQVLVIGVPKATLALWGRLTLAEVMFHHADVRLPARLERALSAIVVTPRLHGIHHSDVAAHQRTNLSSGLALWDRLHGTRCDTVPQRCITMGLPAEAGDVPGTRRSASSETA